MDKSKDAQEKLILIQTDKAYIFYSSYLEYAAQSGMKKVKFKSSFNEE